MQPAQHLTQSGSGRCSGQEEAALTYGTVRKVPAALLVCGARMQSRPRWIPAIGSLSVRRARLRYAIDRY